MYLLLTYLAAVVHGSGGGGVEADGSADDGREADHRGNARVVVVVERCAACVAVGDGHAPS